MWQCITDMARIGRVARRASLVAVAPVLLAHCSGGESGLEVDAGHGGSNGDSSIGSQNGGDDASAAGDAAAGGSNGDAAEATEAGGGAPGAADAGDAASALPPIPVPEGGAPSDPGTVVCNGAACPVKQGYTCCVQPGDGGSNETCNPPNTPCGGGLSIACDEAADCNGGVCCQAINGIAVAGSTTCSAGSSCPDPGTVSFQTCRTDAECGGDAGGATSRCIPQLCTNSVPHRTLAIEACALPATFGDPSGTLAYCAAQ